MRVPPALVLLLGALLSAGCAISRAPAPQAQARPLLAPATLGAERAATQVVRGAFGAHEVTLQCAVAIRGDVMTVVGLTALGARVFTLRYDGREIQQEQLAPAPAHLTAERLLADLQLVYWPLAQLRERFEPLGWDVTEPSAGTRRLLHDGRLIAEVHYDSQDPWRGRSWLANLQYDYTLAIDSEAL